MFAIHSRKVWLAALILIIACGFAYYASLHPMDFRVYHYGARGVFNGTRPVYGPTSGLGWPMHYRYPPLFLLLFTPFALLPLAWGAALWVVLKVAVLVMLLQGMVKRILRDDVQGLEGKSVWVMPFLFVAPYVVEELRYGNAQLFVVALTAAALLIARERPVLSAASLALGIAIKVWPLFFIPYLLVRRDWKVVSYALIFVIFLMLLPSHYFGFQGNLDLVRQWFAQEFQTQFGENEIWFPNQSLRGVLMRYLTVVDYSQVPDSNYPQVHLVSHDPVEVRRLWLGLAGAAYSALLVIGAWRRESEGWFEHGFAFALLALLEPFTQKYALILLLWPAVAAGLLPLSPRLRNLIRVATILALVQPLVPGSAGQRFLQSLGTDFAAAALVAMAMAGASLTQPMVKKRSGLIL